MIDGKEMQAVLDCMSENSEYFDSLDISELILYGIASINLANSIAKYGDKPYIPAVDINPEEIKRASETVLEVLSGFDQLNFLYQISIINLVDKYIEIIKPIALHLSELAGNATKFTYKFGG